jgi:hypothetical protein
MSPRSRFLGFAAFLLAIGLAGLALVGSTPAADDEIPPLKPELKEASLALATAIEKGDAPAAKKQVDVLTKDELIEYMRVFKLRSRNGLGVGAPGVHTPDGIEAKIMGLSRRVMPADLAGNKKDDYARMAYISAGIAEATYAKCPVDKKVGEKDPKDWKMWTDDMKKASLELAAECKKDKPDPKNVQTIAQRLNSSCNNCHGIFRD